MTTPVLAGIRRWPAQPWLSLVARLLLAGVFGASGWLKVIDPSASVRAVGAYELVPAAVARFIGYGLPAVELGLAILLLIGLGVRFAAIVTGVLLVVFIGGVISVWARGMSIDCGCFGGGGEVASGATRYVEEIARDLGLLLVAGWLALFPNSPFALDRSASPHVHDQQGLRHGQEVTQAPGRHPGPVGSP